MPDCSAFSRRVPRPGFNRITRHGLPAFEKAGYRRRTGRHEPAGLEATPPHDGTLVGMGQWQLAHDL